MIGRFWLSVPIIGAWLLLASTAVAQDADSRSHIPIHSKADSPSTAQGFMDMKRGRARAMSSMAKLAQEVLNDPEKYGLTREDLAKLAKSQGQDPSDPSVRQLIERLDGNPNDLQELRKKLQLTEADVQDLKKLVEEHKQGSTGESGTSATTSPITPPKIDLPSSLSKAELERRERATSAVNRFFGDLVGKNGRLPRSSELGKALGNMMKPSDRVTLTPPKGGSSLPRLSKSLGLDSVWSKMSMNGKRLPSLSGLKLGGGGGPSMPSFGGGGGGGVSGGAEGLGVIGTMILWIGLMAVLAIIVWRLMVWQKGLAEERARAGVAKLGGWPIAPSEVFTREQFIRAFEYLSVLWLGLPARHWNHREIEARLSAAQPAERAEQRRAAHQLADVYEHARYLPGEEPLPEAELEAARRDLSFLAGAATP